VVLTGQSLVGLTGRSLVGLTGQSLVGQSLVGFGLTGRNLVGLGLVEANRSLVGPVEANRGLVGPVVLVEANRGLAGPVLVEANRGLAGPVVKKTRFIGVLKMSFDMLPKDVVWLILSDVVTLVWNEYYHIETIYGYTFGRTLSFMMADELHRLSGVCKLWRTLTVNACKTAYNGFKFKAGKIRYHSTYYQ
jgi:hypothetical protein